MSGFVSLNELAPQRVFRGTCGAMLLVLGLSMLLALPSSGQNSSQRNQQQIMDSMRSQNVDSFSLEQVDQSGIISPEDERRLRLFNAERQKRMVADAEKLLKLAAELNAEVKAANTGTLTPAQLREVAEMEKLAHSVKKEMSSSMRIPPDTGSAFSAIYR
jgi:hypothetical protein